MLIHTHTHACTHTHTHAHTHGEAWPHPVLCQVNSHASAPLPLSTDGKRLPGSGYIMHPPELIPQITILWLQNQFPGTREGGCCCRCYDWPHSEDDHHRLSYIMQLNDHFTETTLWDMTSLPLVTGVSPLLMLTDRHKRNTLTTMV